MTVEPRLNYLRGCWRPAASGETYFTHGPMQPNEALAAFPASGPDDAGEAVAAAAEAFPDWARTPAAQRARLLETAAVVIASRVEEIAREMTVEMGKPLRESRGEVQRATQILRYFAGEAYRSTGESFEQSANGGQVFTRRRPLGVVALITPWNFPIAIPVWKLAPALIYGNTVVLKPAIDAPATALNVAAALHEAGLPPGVLNVVTGAGSTVGAALVEDSRIAGVSFTGSVGVGEEIRRETARTGKRVQLELGGQNPLVVMDDADLPRAVEAAFAGAFFSAGQKCTATRRIYVQSGVYERFRDLLVRRIAASRIGDPEDPETEVGPVVNERQLAHVIAAIERGRAEGGTVLTGGKRVDRESLLVEPTLFEYVADEAFLSCEEVFGPVASLYCFDTLDEALRRANAVRFGLSAAVFTSSLATAVRFEAEAAAGLIHVNSQTAGADVHVPFGGIKTSGYGPHEQGRAAMEFFTESITIYANA